jgi:hypothetical protein
MNNALRWIIGGAGALPATGAFKLLSRRFPYSFRTKPCFPHLRAERQTKGD